MITKRCLLKYYFNLTLLKIWIIAFFNYPENRGALLYMLMCVCVCVYKRDRDKNTHMETERECEYTRRSHSYLTAQPFASLTSS